MINFFKQIILFMDKIGLMNVILPFLIVFAVVFGLLEKTKVFGQDAASNRKLNLLIAFVLGFGVVTLQSVVAKMNQFLYFSGLFVVFVFLFQLVLSTILPNFSENKIIIPIFIISFVVLLLKVFKINIGKFGAKVLSFLPLELIIITAVAFGVIYFITYEKGVVPKTTTKQPPAQQAATPAPDQSQALPSPTKKLSKKEIDGAVTKLQGLIDSGEVDPTQAKLLQEMIKQGKIDPKRIGL